MLISVYAEIEDYSSPPPLLEPESPLDEPEPEPLSEEPLPLSEEPEPESEEPLPLSEEPEPLSEELPLPVGGSVLHDVPRLGHHAQVIYVGQPRWG